MPDEITPHDVYLNRRRWMKAAAIAASVPTTAALYRSIYPVDQDVVLQPRIEEIETSLMDHHQKRAAGFVTRESPSSLYDITHLNNFHEFTTDQHAVATVAKGFQTDGWTVSVDGLVERPLVLKAEELLSRFMIEERVYRMRCVEGWSMVIPWVGFPLAALLELAVPRSDAKYVAFESLHDTGRMPNQIPGELQWPYTEGLRLDEAFHPLTIIAIGLYGRELPPQNGAPLRLVVPWKYGFKSIKSVVKISLVAERPETAWNQASPHENGFYANVNPEVDHPRWSQATERRVGEFFRRQTLMFNGYEKQVAHLYQGMDLHVDY